MEEPVIVQIEEEEEVPLKLPHHDEGRQIPAEVRERCCRYILIIIILSLIGCISLYFCVCTCVCTDCNLDIMY